MRHETGAVHLYFNAPPRFAARPGGIRVGTKSMNNKMSLTIQDVNKTTGIGRTKIFELIRDGKLPARKIGTRTIILAEDLKIFLDKLPSAGNRAV